MKMPFIVGPPVRQLDDFYGRAKQTRQFYDTLAGSQVQCVSVIGLRRAGKTSFLQHVAHPDVLGAHLRDAGRYAMVYVDVSACQTPADFYRRVYRQLLSHLPGRRSRAAEPAAEAADAYALESLLYTFRDRRIVLLLDEFDQLRTAAFGQEFLTQLRALASVWDYELAYVTASYWDLYRLGNFVGLPTTSPFYNIFYPTPIYLSGLNPAELEELVRVPSRRVGVAADDDDIAYIRHIAGSLPFFVQATAAVWLPGKTRRQLPDEREVTRQLASEMGPYFEHWWRNFSDVERDALACVVNDRPVERLPYAAHEIEEALRRMKAYGLIMQTGDHLWADSQLFSHWLREYTGRPRAVATSRRATGNGLSSGAARPIQAPPAADATRILDAVARAGQHPAASWSDGEEVLRDELLGVLESSLGRGARAATFAPAGQHEILAQANGANTYAIACLLWRGQKALLQDVDRLLSHLTRPDAGAALLIYARSRDYDLVREAAAEALRKHAQLQSLAVGEGGSTLEGRFRLPANPAGVATVSVRLFRLRD